MATLREIATALRNVADVLDKSPDIEAGRPGLDWYFFNAKDKQKFLDLAKAFPRPFKKTYEDDPHGWLRIAFEQDALKTEAQIYRSAVCEIVEPAKPPVYHCPSLLSDDEEVALTESAE